MPSLSPVTIGTAWTLVQAGPFTGRVSNIGANRVFLRVATSMPTGAGGSTLDAMTYIQLAAGESLYAYAHHLPAIVQLDPEIIQVSSPPLSLLTDRGGDYTRIRVDPDQTSFWQGHQYRTFRELNIATGQTAVLRVNVPVNAVLYDVSLVLDAGSIRLRTLSGGTEGGTFGTPVPVLRKNTMTDCPNIPAQVSVSTGGTHTGGTDIDVIRLVVAGATAQQTSVGSKPFDQRGVGPGVYYWRLENIGNSAATGVFSGWWEERPPI